MVQIVGLDTSFNERHSMLTHTDELRQASYRDDEVEYRGACTGHTMPGTISCRKNAQCVLGY